MFRVVYQKPDEILMLLCRIFLMVRKEHLLIHHNLHSRIGLVDM